MVKLIAALRLLKTNIRPLIVFELLYKLCGTIILTPLLNVVFSVSLHFSGLRYVTNSNLLYFLTRPVTVLAIVFMLFVLALFTLTELSAITHCLNASQHRKPLSLFEMTRRAAVTTLRSLRPRNWGALLLMMLAAPFVHFVTISSLLPNSALPSRLVLFAQEHIWMLAVLIAAVIIVYFLALRYVFAINYFTLRRIPFRQALRLSVRLQKGRFWRNFFSFVLYVVLVAAVLLVVFAVLLLLLVSVIKIISPERLGLARALTGANIFAGISAMLITLLAMPLVNAFVAVLFYGTKVRTGEAIEPHLPPRRIPSKIRRIIGISLSAALLTGATVSAVLDGFKLPFYSDIEISAHRGESITAPENTLPAFAAAIESGADYIELDLQMTADGVVVAAHDANLYRVSGESVKVSELSYDELRLLEVGSWFGEEFAGTRIPTLTEILDLTEGKISLILELKPADDELHLAAAVLSIIEQYELSSKCIIMSRSYNVLSFVRENNEDVRTAYLLSAAYGPVSALENADIFSVNASFISRNLISNIHSEHKDVFVWTVNTAASAKRLAEMGVDNIITDDPVFIREVLSSDAVGGVISNIVYSLFSEQERMQ